MVYDAAHAFGASYADGRRAGGAGAAEVFSLHATKLFNSFEGGLVATNDDRVARRIGSARNFGFGGRGPGPEIKRRVDAAARSRRRRGVDD